MARRMDAMHRMYLEVQKTEETWQNKIPDKTGRLQTWDESKKEMAHKRKPDGFACLLTTKYDWNWVDSQPTKDQRGGFESHLALL